MIVGIVSRAICNISCYLYPAYASYKALSATPVSAPEVTQDVERWLMYWSVVGTWTGLEGLAGFLFTWIPFYSFFKMLFFLYLSLPQSQGSTYIYSTQLAPVFRQHERDIDAFLSTLRYRAGGFLSGFVSWIWEKARSQLNAAPQQTQGYPQHPGMPDPYMHGQQPPPTLSNPASGAAQQLFSMASRYAVQYIPVAVNAMRPMGQQQARGVAQDAALTPQDEGYNEMPIPRPTPSHSRRSDPDMNIRSRISSHSDMGYEEIERSEAENAGARPGLTEHRSGSWFGWGAQTPKSKAE